MNKPITVMVTAIGGGGHGDQILKALLLAAPGRYRIIGADTNPYCPQFAHVDQALTLPYANDPSYIDAVLDVCRRFSVKVLFHGCEPELRVFSHHRERLIEAGLFLPISPREVIDICMDKFATGEFLKRHGFAPPQLVKATSREVLAAIDWFPVVLKPSVGSGGSRDVFIAQSRQQLLRLADYIALTPDQEFIVQEYVGMPDNEYTVGVLHDMDGNFINSIAVKRDLAGQLNIRSMVPNTCNRSDLGPRLAISSGISQGIVDCFPEVTEPCERIAKALVVRGVVNIQCRLVKGEVKVFEINPRFSGTTSLRAMAGYNEPDVLIRRHVFGETIEPRFSYRRINIVRSLSENVLSEEPAPYWRDIVKSCAL